VDYTRTERVQFEDDEYYYYVKAVPKNMIAEPKKTVKKIVSQKKQTKTIKRIDS
jgi:disulfide oxidoreductase YuzD